MMDDQAVGEWKVEGLAKWDESEVGESGGRRCVVGQRRAEAAADRM